MKRIQFLIVALCALASNISAEHHDHSHDHEFTQQHIHDHGKVVATISHAQNQIYLHLTLPAYNAFGFEHAPNNEQQQTLVDSALKKLSQTSNVVEFQPSCITDSTNIVDSHKDMSSTVDKHFDVEIEYIFTCPSNNSILISFSLFKTIPSINKIEVQYISDTKQRLVTLDAEHHTITID